MNEILTALYARKSMRAYTKEPVSPEKKELILRAACSAPTTGNQQLYSDFSREMSRSVEEYLKPFRNE